MPERRRTLVEGDVEDSSEFVSDRAGEDEELAGSDKRKHRSSKSRKPGSGEEAEGFSGSSGRRRSSGGDRNTETRKRSSGPGSDEDEYETRKENRSKQMKKKQEESSLEQLSSWYQDGELENRQSGNKGGGSNPDEIGRTKLAPKVLESDGSGNGSKRKEESSHDAEHDRALERESRASERRESSRERGHGSSDAGRSSRKKWDDQDFTRKADGNHHENADPRSGKPSESKHENSKERSTSARYEPSEGKAKSSSREDKRFDSERNRSKSRSEAVEDDTKDSPSVREEKFGRERNDKHRQQRTPTSVEVPETRGRSSNVDEDGNIWTRDKRDLGHSNRPRSPDRSIRRHQESQSEIEYDRSIDNRRKDIEKDGARDDRSKGRDDSWNDRNRDRESSKENWKRRQLTGNERESKDGDIAYDRGRDWEPRHGRERNDNERPHGRSRGEAVKTSSNFGISNDNYDVIEVPLDHGRAESGSHFSWRNEASQQPDGKFTSNVDDWVHGRDERARRHSLHGSASSADDLKEKYVEDDSRSWRDDVDYQGAKGRGQKAAISGHGAGGPSFSNSSQFGNHEGRIPSQGPKGSRMGRGGRGRPSGIDNQQVGLPLSIMGSPFGPLGMPPPGPMQPIAPSMSPAPPISPSVFLPSFSPPVMWPGARGVEMNMLGVPPAMSPVPPGPTALRFPPNAGAPPSNPAMFMNQGAPSRGVPPAISNAGIVPAGPVRGTAVDKASGGWVPPRSSGPPGKAPSRGEQNDYSQNFVDTGMRPQNFIRELELTNVVEDYPKLRELIQKKDEIVAKSASAPMYMKCDLREFELSPEFFRTKFDVILVDPPWEEYVHRAPGVADHMEYWTFEDILNLKIEAIADTPSFIFLWVGDGVGLEQGRQCLKKWGFRRCEDICWVKTNKTNATPGLRHDSHTLFQRSKEHCLMGIKGTVRRSTDGHIIHANIDTDVIIAEEPPYGSTQKPEDMYRIIEHFSLGRRRLELFGEDHNIRSGWLTVGKGLSSSNFNAEGYIRNFADKDGKVWQGGGGRNPPPEAPHLVLTTPEIESLRPKSPMKNQQQQSSSVSLTAGNSSNRRPAANSPQNPSAFNMNHEASGSNPSTPAPWASPMEGFRGRDSVNIPTDDKAFDMHGYIGQANVDYVDFESRRQMNLL
ncbi:hypothetical protein Tsubulata_024502 [Turnera subulata]|uniref:Methyltransferase-like protein 1 n=1 Tax=Turnera subulata TaxID=218843 RepID=A0A9Q0J322_9ROSI|nr:hypothetical protein Tsubulata_024502 [Turnera subulata]